MIVERSLFERKPADENRQMLKNQRAERGKLWWFKVNLMTAL